MKEVSSESNLAPMQGPTPLKPLSSELMMGNYLLKHGKSEDEYWIMPDTNDQPLGPFMKEALGFIHARSANGAMTYLEANGLAETVRKNPHDPRSSRINERLTPGGRAVIAYSMTFEQVKTEEAPKPHNYSNYKPENLRETLHHIHAEISLIADDTFDTGTVDELMKDHLADPGNKDKERLTAAKLRQEIRGANHRFDELIKMEEDPDNDNRNGRLNELQLQFLHLHHSIEEYLYLLEEPHPENFMDLDPRRIPADKLPMAIDSFKSILERMKAKAETRTIDLAG